MAAMDSNGNSGGYASTDRGPFANIRETPMWVIITALVLISGTTAALNLVVFAGDFLGPARETTAGLVTPTLLANMGMFLLFVHLFIRMAGRLRYRDLGLRHQQLAQGLALTALVWLVIQSVGLVWSLSATGAVALDTIWQRLGVTYVLGRFIGQLAGNALFEETVYRGFLLPQAAKKLRALPANNPRRRIILAVSLSQLVFALIHIPGRLLQGMDLASMPASLALVFILGILFATMYVRTGNLWICVGTHALINAPCSLFASQGLGQLTAIALAIVVAFIGPRFRSTRGNPAEDLDPGATLET